MNALELQEEMWKVLASPTVEVFPEYIWWSDRIVDYFTIMKMRAIEKSLGMRVSSLQIDISAGCVFCEIFENLSPMCGSCPVKKFFGSFCLENWYSKLTKEVYGILPKIDFLQPAVPVNREELLGKWGRASWIIENSILKLEITEEDRKTLEAHEVMVEEGRVFLRKRGEEEVKDGND